MKKITTIIKKSFFLLILLNNSNIKVPKIEINTIPFKTWISCKILLLKFKYECSISHIEEYP